MYRRLLEPGKINMLDIQNRVVMSAAGLTLAESNGEIGQRIIAYIEERAKSRLGIIYPGAVAVDSKTGLGNTHMLILEKKSQIKGMSELVARVHKYDAKLFIQLYHPGKNVAVSNLSGGVAFAPSPYKTADGKMAKEMTQEDIDYVISRFVNSAKLAVIAGVDGIELHAAHGYLLNQFLSPVFNKRTDQYGGSLENRMRLTVEVYEAVRKVVGPKYALGIRISADEFIEGGNTLEDGVRMCKNWDKIGFDFINVSAGVQETSEFNREPPSYPQGWKTYLSKTIKEAVSCPVIAVNTIKKPDYAESLLEDGVCDYVALARQLIADPAWLYKAEHGKEDEIRICLSCLNCHQSNATGGLPTCSVNPCVGREIEFKTLYKNGYKRPVAVVGGGPGGLQASLVLAKRGFDVHLFEEKDHLGGQLNYAEMPPNKEKITWFKSNLINEVMRSNITVHLSSKATIEELKSIRPIAVFAACGSFPIIPIKIQGMDGKNVFVARDVLTGNEVPGHEVVVIGGGMVGLETAEFLGEKGYHVSVVEMLPEVGAGMQVHVLKDSLRHLAAYNTNYFTAHTLVSINKNSVSVKDKDGKVFELLADAVVLAMGSRPNNDKVLELKANFEQVFVIGDAQKDGKIVNAMTDGFTKAWVYESEQDI